MSHRPGDADPPRRRRISRRRLLQAGVAAAVAAPLGTGLYAWRVEPHWVRVIDRPLPLANLPPAWRGRTLVQVSDLHVGPVVDADYLRAALQRVNALKPDLLCITGDLITYDGDERITEAADVVSALNPAPLGTFLTLGNHDYGFAWSQPYVADRLALHAAKHGIRTLRNDAVVIDGLQLAGVDSLLARRSDIAAAHAGLDADRPTVTLTHNPDTVDEPGWAGHRGWILTGHTHGGQVAPPLVGPPILPVRNRRYAAGHYDLGRGRHLYVNRGLGYLKRVRFNARPEITRFTLVDA